MIGKTLFDKLGVTEKLGGTTNATVNIITKVETTELNKLKQDIQDCNTTAQVDVVIKEHGLSDIEGLPQHIKELYEKGEISSLKGSDVNNFITQQNYTNIAKQASGFKGVNEAIKEYNKLTDTASKSKLVETISTTNTSLGKYLTGLNGADAGLGSYAGSLVTATAKTFALEAATMAMNAVVSMGISFLVSTTISAIFSWADNVIHAAEKTKEAAEEAKSAINTIKSDFDNLSSTTNDVKERFAELAQGVENLGKINQSRGTLSTDDYDEFLDLSNQLAELFPQLTKGYDENGNAILNLSGNVDTIVGSLDNMISVQQKLANQEILEKMPDVWAGYTVDLDEYTKELEDAEKELNIYQDLLNNVSNTDNPILSTSLDVDSAIGTALRNIGIDSKSIDKLRNINYKRYRDTTVWDSTTWDFSTLTESELEQLKNILGSLGSEYEDAVQLAKGKIESANSGMSSYINTWLSSEWNFSKMDSDMQNLVKDVLLNSDWLSQLPNDVDSDDWDEVSNWLQQKFLYEINKIDSDEIQDSLVAAFNNSLSVESLKDLINQIMKTEGLDENNPLIVYLDAKLEDAEILQRQIDGVIQFAKNKFDGYDPTAFFNEHSINTQEEIDAWWKIAQGVNSVAEAEEKYLEIPPSAINFNSESFLKSVSAIQSGYETLLDAQEEFIECGAISASTLKNLMDNNLIQYLQYTADGLSINTAALEYNEQALKNAATAELYNAMCNDIQNLSLEDTSKLSSIAQTAIANLDSAATTAGANAAVAAQGWWEYGASIKSISGVSDLTGDNYKKAEAIVNQYKNIANSINSLSIRKTHSTNKSSSGSSSTSSDPLKDAFTQEYNTLKHNLEMDYITEKQYYDSLAALNRKYFAGKKEYSDEYRQYEEEVYKGLKSYYTDYAESQMNLLESQLDAGIINYAHYSSTIKSLLDNMYSDSGLSAEDYHKYIQQMLNKQLDIYDKVLSAVTSRIEKEIDGIEDIIDSIEKQNDTLENQLDNYDSILSVIASVYEAEIDRIKTEQDAIQENIDALQDENDQRELALKLEEARWALYKAQNQRTKKIFNGTEFVYETDQAAVREAQESLADLELEQVVDGLEREKDALDDTISELEKYRDLWAEITDVYEKEANEQLIIALYGKDYQKIILRNQLGDIEAFKNNYVSIQNQINDNEGLIASYKEKTEYYEALKQQWSDISDAYENSMETQYAAMILGQNWESDVLNGRLDTLNRFKNQYVSLQQQIADATIAANNAIAASNEAVKNSQISSSVSAGNSGNSVSGSSASDSPTSNNLTSSSSGSSNSAALWRIVDYSSGATLKTGLKTAAEVSSWCSANGYTIVSENANTRIAAAKNKTTTATTAAIQKSKAPATKHYASGTANAQKGLNLVGEAGTETYIDNDGNVSLVTKPSLIPMEGGETVIKASETEKILSNMESSGPSDNNAVLSGLMDRLSSFNEEEFRQKLMSIMPGYSSMVQIPNLYTPNYDWGTVNRDNSVKVEIGDIHLHEVQKADTLANEIIRELPNKVIQRLGRK